MSPPNINRQSAADWKAVSTLVGMLGLCATGVAAWTTNNERHARTEVEIQALKQSEAKSSATTQRELDRMARALEALQGDIKELGNQLRDRGRAK